jgi:thioredoxin reductase (NADPH)
VDLKLGVIGGPDGDGGGSYDLVIAGGGPAALSAALYAARYGISHIVIESYQPGGQAALTALIENYPGIPSVEGSSLTSAMKKQAEAAGAGFRAASVTGCSREEGFILVSTDSDTFRARTLIIATGASPRRLGVPGEDEYYGRGVSYCATCDAPFFRDRKVLVVGGGDSAVKEALHLNEFASSVTIVHRRDSLRAEPLLVQKLLSCGKCSVVWNSGLREIRGGDFVESVLLDTPEGERELPVDGVFLYVGREPATAPFRGLVDLNEDGTVATRGIVHTSSPDVFAAGDVTDNELRQVVTAASDGARAASAAFEFIQTSAP